MTVTSVGSAPTPVPLAPLDTPCYTEDMSKLSIALILAFIIVSGARPAPEPTSMWFTPDAPLDTSQTHWLY